MGKNYVIDEFVDPIKKLGCQFIDNPLLDRHGTNPVKELKLISFYKKVIRDVKPDIVFTYTIKPNAYGGMACASLVDARKAMGLAGRAKVEREFDRQIVIKKYLDEVETVRKR